MQSYKIEITASKQYIFDIQAPTAGEAKDMAERAYYDAVEQGTDHYYQQGDEFITAIHPYEVTGTDDDAFLESASCSCAYHDKDGNCTETPA